MKKILWIEVSETVKRNIGLEIGEDISEEDAQELLDLHGDEFDMDSEEYPILDGYLGTEISDSDGFFDVNIYITE